MFKNSRKVIIIIVTLILIPLQCYAAEYTKLNDLIENSMKMDKKEVKIKAEAIGEPMKRGDHTWVNVNDGSNSMGLWMKNEDAEKIKVYGNYKYSGDFIEVAGIYNRSCKEHGGDIDIHVDSIKIVEKGFHKGTSINGKRLKVVGVLLVSTSILVYFYKRK